MIFDIPIEPVAQGRPRFMKRGKFMHAYDPAKSRTYKGQIAQYIKKDFYEELIDEPVFISYFFYRSVPKNFSKSNRKKALEGSLMPSTRPDLDNYIKSTQDALIGSVLKDDNIIISTFANKNYDSKAHVVIEIRKLVDNDGSRITE